MDHKIRMGFGAETICAIVFGCMGGVYTVIGVFTLLTDGSGPDTLSFTFIPLGIGFLAAAGVLLILELLRLRRAGKLVEGGRFLRCHVTHCEANYLVRLNRRHPYVVWASFVDGQGTVHQFRSWSSLKYNSPGLIGKQVKVYIQDDRYRKYYMDVEEILPHTVIH